MTYLRVSHLPFWQTYILAASGKERGWVTSSKLVNVWLALGVNDIRLIFFPLSPPVENHQKYLLIHFID
jgi:hypothetical protein